MRYILPIAMLFLSLCKTANARIIAYNVKISEWNGVYIKDTKTNRVIYKYMPRASMEFYSLYDTVDITGDGYNEIIIEHYSGGAHCCTDYIVLQTNKNGELKELWNFDAGNGGITKISDIDGDRIKEIITTADCLAYFADLPYAYTKPLPRIFKYKKGLHRFDESTLEYPWIFDKYILDYCKGIKNSSGEEERAYYVALVAIYMLKDQTLQGYLKCEKCGVSEETINWFYNYREELFNLLRGYYHF